MGNRQYRQGGSGVQAVKARGSAVKAVQARWEWGTGKGGVGYRVGCPLISLGSETKQNESENE